MKERILKHHCFALSLSSIVFCFLSAIPSYCQSEVLPANTQPIDSQLTEKNGHSDLTEIKAPQAEALPQGEENTTLAKDANALLANNKLDPAPIKKASVGKKVLSVATAFVVGTPICMVRRSKYEEWYGLHGMVSDADNKAKKIILGTFWLPCAVFCGVLEAPCDAGANASCIRLSAKIK